MIERWHRALKTAIMCQNNQEWTDVLSTVLLGLRTSIKEDIGASTAELLYGITLRLPGVSLDIEPSNQPRIFLEQLRQTMRTIRPYPTAHYRKDKSFVYKELNSCSHVFVRIDAVRKPLESPYEGPFQVTRRISDRVFEIDFKGEPTIISTERLKPAFFENVPDNLETSMGASQQQQHPLVRTYQRPIKKVQFKV